MNWKKGLVLAIISAALSSIACFIYNKIYSEAFYVDFGPVLNPVGIISSSLIGCVLMALGYVLLHQWKKDRWFKWANVLYGIVSFASIAGVLSYNLPLDVEFPEMFPGLAIPMHFFPLLSFLTVYPFFWDQDIQVKRFS